MNILLPAVSSSCGPDGVGRHAANVARSLLLHSEIQRIDFLVGAWQEESLRALLGAVDDRLHLSIADTKRSAWSRNRWYWSHLPDLARRFDSDLIHVAYPVPIQRSAVPCPVVATLHDLYPYDIPENFGYPRVLVNRVILHQCLRAVDKVACVSNSTMHRLEIHLPTIIHKALIIHNAVALAEPTAALGPLADWTGEPFLLCVAQHRRNKNVPVAIRVLEYLLRSEDVPTNMRLFVVGTDGPETAKIMRLIRRLGLDKYVVLLHSISDADLHWCYAHCEALIAPSSIEGFGLPIIEAMAHHCRIVCSDIPAFREVGGSYCDYVPLQNGQVEAFVEATRRALTDRKFRTPQSSSFSAARVGAAYLRLYRGLLQAAGTSCSRNDCDPVPALRKGRP